MAGIDFDRQVFIPKADTNPQQLNRILGLVVLVIAVGALGFVGYKLLSDYSGGSTSADAQTIEQLQQQLSEMSKRVEQLEKHRKVTPAEPTPKAIAIPAAQAPAPKQTTYKISAASVLPAQRIPANETPIAQPSAQLAAVQQVANASNEMAEANHEAWQATTDRLADVVGVVGSQQSELSRTREELNKLLAQTRRSAVQFELRHGANREPVGPVSLLLRNADPKNQRYTVCVYLGEDQCIELKNRAVDEVVVFVVSENSAPLELVATKVLRDQIVGYLEVPSDKPTP